MLVGFDDEKLEGSSGFTSFFSTVGVSTFCFLVSSIFVSTNTSLDF
jgi:hypothetical protein